MSFQCFNAIEAYFSKKKRKRSKIVSINAKIDGIHNTTSGVIGSNDKIMNSLASPPLSSF